MHHNQKPEHKQKQKQFKLPSRKLPVEIKPTAIMATNAASSVDYAAHLPPSGILGIFLKTFSLGSGAEPIIRSPRSSRLNNLRREAINVTFGFL